MDNPMRIISSSQNPTVKWLLTLLQKSRARKKEQRFIVEGLRELSAAATSGNKAETIFINEVFKDHPDLKELMSKFPDADKVAMSSSVFEKCAYRAHVPNALGVFPTCEKKLNDLLLPKNPLLLILDKIEKPGNLGAMLRTADAAGVNAIIITDPLTDIYNPNVIRNSLGSFFTKQIAVAQETECIEWLEKNQIATYVTYLEAAKPYWDVNYKSATAIVLGTEAVGVGENWIRAAKQNIIIPMSGSMDSLNVSNAAAIVLFEAVRQRQAR